MHANEKSLKTKSTETTQTDPYFFEDKYSPGRADKPWALQNKKMDTSQRQLLSAHL